MKLFAKGIKERNMDVKLCALESGNIGDTAKGYYEAMAADEDISSVLGVHSFHSYFNDTNALKKVNSVNGLIKMFQCVPI